MAIRIQSRLASVGLGSLLLMGAVGCQPFSKSLMRSGAADQELTTRLLSDDQVIDVQVAAAETIERSGDLPGAVAAYKQILDRDPRCGRAAHRLAILYDREGRFDEAAKHYKTALKQTPENTDLLCDRGYSLYLQGKLAEAEELYKKCLTIDNYHRRSHNNLGLIYGRTDRLKESLAEFAKAGCRPADAHANLAYALALDERLGDALEQYDLALKEDPACQAAQRGRREIVAVAHKMESDRLAAR